MHVESKNDKAAGKDQVLYWEFALTSTICSKSASRRRLAASQAMVDRISGMKVLLLDEETIGTVSLVSRCNCSFVTVR